MRTIGTLHRNTQTFLTHLFGRGLDDDRYVVERFQTMADGEIRHRRGNGRPEKGRPRGLRKVMSLRAVRRLRPERNEIIVATGVSLAGSGVQYWGDLATGLFVNGNCR